MSKLTPRNKFYHAGYLKTLIPQFVLPTTRLPLLADPAKETRCPSAEFNNFLLFVAIRADIQSLVAVGSEVRYFAIDGDDGVSAAFGKWRCLNDLLGNILIE